MWLGQEPDPRPWGKQDETRTSEGAARAPLGDEVRPRGRQVRTSPGVNPARCWNQREPKRGVALPRLDGLAFSILPSDDSILLSWLVTLYHLTTTVTRLMT